MSEIRRKYDPEFREATHGEPVWRDRADFIIAVRLTDSSEVETEQLWGRRVDEFLFEICCIPFFAYDLALGDMVETDDNYLVQRVLKASGRGVFRVWFGDSFHPRDETADLLVALGATLEWSSPNLLAVDAANERMASEVSRVLFERERLGYLSYETGDSG